MNVIRTSSNIHTRGHPNPWIRAKSESFRSSELQSLDTNTTMISHEPTMMVKSFFDFRLAQYQIPLVPQLVIGQRVPASIFKIAFPCKKSRQYLWAFGQARTSLKRHIVNKTKLKNHQETRRVFVQ